MVKSALRLLGRRVIGRVELLLSFWRIAASALGSFVFRSWRNRAAADVILKQIYFTGFEAVPIVSWIAVILGLVIVTQSLSILPRVGGEHMIGGVLVWVVVRELGPIFASVIVIARSGTAIAAELGSMKISRETTALELMGIDPVRYLVMPRVIGTAVSVFVLTFYFETVTILGGYLLAGFGKRMAFSVYISSVLESMGFLEIGASLLKSVLFGLIIGVVCSAHGLMVEKSITRIPQETTNAVIGSLRLVFVVDAVITFIFFYI